MEKTGVYVSNKHGDSMIHSLSLGFSMAFFFLKERTSGGKVITQKMTLNINL